MSQAVVSAAAPVAAAPVVETATPAVAVTPPAQAAAGAEAPKAEVKAAEAPKPTHSEIRKMKLRLEGQDIEATEEEVIRLAQQAAGSQKRFQEAANIRKEAEQVLEFLKANPKEALSKLGIDIRKFSEETLMEILQREAETPDQKVMREKDERLRAYETKEKEQEEVAKKTAAQKEQERQQQVNREKEASIIKKYDEVFVEALNKSGLPKNAWTVARMATLTRINLKNKMDLGADQLATIVKEDYSKELKAQYPKNDKGEYDGEKLIQMFGDDIVKAIVKHRLSKLKSAKQTFSEPQPTQQKQEVKTERWRDFQKRNRLSRT